MSSTSVPSMDINKQIYILILGTIARSIVSINRVGWVKFKPVLYTFLKELV